MSREAVDKIQAAIGSITVARLDDLASQARSDDLLYESDAVATAVDGAVRTTLNAGTVFPPYADSRLRLGTITGDPGRPASPARVSRGRGAFASSARRLAKIGDFGIDTAADSLRARARGSGVVALSIATLVYSLLRDIRYAHALSTDDDTITPKDSEFGTFEIVTRSGAVIQVDDPGLTYSVDSGGAVTRQVNSSSRMEELQAAQQAALGTFARGIEGPPGSSTPPDSQLDPASPPPAIPINFQPLGQVPEFIAPVFAPPPPDVQPAEPEPPRAAEIRPPAIRAFTIDSGKEGDRITNNNNLVLLGTAEPGSTVAVYDGDLLLGTTTADESGAWSFMTGRLSDGEHAFTVAAGEGAAARTAFSAFGAAAATDTGPASAAYVVVIDTQAPCSPVITAFADNSGYPADNLTDDTTPTLTINAEAGSTVHVYRDGILVGTATETAVAGVFTFTSEELGDGCYDFTATATDTANNTSGSSCAFEIRVDNTAPVAPTITALAHDCHLPSGILTDDTTPTLVIAAESGATVHVFVDGVLAGTAAETETAGIFNFTSRALADGNHTFTAVATDAADHRSPPSDGFKITLATSDPNDFDDLAMGHCIVFGHEGVVHGTRDADFFHFRDDGCEPGRTIYAGAGNDHIKGTSQDDTVYGGSGKDLINGNCGADIIFGGFGHDRISGGDGNDILVGGYGADCLAGGKGHDSFIFLSAIDSPACQRDIISDFESGCDRIDLSGVDANSRQDADQAFNFVGQTDSRTVVANSVTWYYDAESCQTYVLSDTDGDTATAELEIALAGRVTIKQSDFVL